MRKTVELRRMRNKNLCSQRAIPKHISGRLSGRKTSCRKKMQNKIWDDCEGTFKAHM